MRESKINMEDKEETKEETIVKLSDILSIIKEVAWRDEWYKTKKFVEKKDD